MAQTFVGAMTSPTGLALLGTGVALSGIYAAQRIGVTSLDDITLTKNQALTGVSVAAGLVGTASSGLALRRLEDLEGDTITIKRLFKPAVFLIGSTFTVAVIASAIFGG